LRVVLDTNVLVSALLFRDGRLTWMRAAWQAGRFDLLLDHACAAELVRVLGYPKFALDREQVEALLGEVLPHARPVAVGRTRIAGLPRCRDRHDQKFLTLATAGDAEVLVTGDQALLDLAPRASFAIESPAEFRRRLP
jgi:putative PIN family toxin of toxin-antitoxin system